MSLVIDRKKLKIKYFLDVHKECTEYPTEEDYVYELVNCLQSLDMLYEPFGTTFCRRSLFYALLSPNNDHEHHLEMLKKLETQGIVELVEEGGVRNSRFKLKTHPWV